MRECFLVLAGYGDLGSERAYLRTEAITCVRSDGGAIEVPIDAYATGEDGKATAEFEMPENLTTWKVNAWGMTTETRVGQASTSAVTTKNLLVRLQAPRFFMEYDEVVLSANVHNYLEDAKQVQAVLEFDGDTLELLEGHPARQTIEVARCAEAAGFRGIALADHHDRNVPWCFNRKEAKDHGEGGTLVGAPLQGRVLVIDDVITAGTAIGEVAALIEGAGASLAGVVIGPPWRCFSR